MEYKNLNYKKENEDVWDLIIAPRAPSFNLNINQILKYRDLIMLFVRRDFVSYYKQTILGPLWFFIQPILTTITFTVIFGNIAAISTDGIPTVVFYLAGITVWSYFSDCLIKTSETFISNQQIFGKVYFPRIIVPISIVISNIIKLGIQFLLFIMIWIYYLINNSSIAPNWCMFLFPLLVFIMAGIGLGAGMLISSMTTKYRDLRFLIQFGVQLFMYATPIVYPLSVVSEKYRLIILANPMTGIIEAFKYGFLGGNNFQMVYLLYSFCFMLVILFIGLVVFNKVEKSFVDVV